MQNKYVGSKIYVVWALYPIDVKLEYLNNNKTISRRVLLTLAPFSIDSRAITNSHLDGGTIFCGWRSHFWHSIIDGVIIISHVRF